MLEGTGCPGAPCPMPRCPPGQSGDSTCCTYTPQQVPRYLCTVPTGWSTGFVKGGTSGTEEAKLGAWGKSKLGAPFHHSLPPPFTDTPHLTIAPWAWKVRDWQLPDSHLSPIPLHTPVRIHLFYFSSELIQGSTSFFPPLFQQHSHPSHTLFSSSLLLLSCF